METLLRPLAAHRRENHGGTYTYGEENMKSKHPENTGGRGTPVMVNGVWFASKTAAAVDVGCKTNQIAKALKTGQLLWGRKIELAPAEKPAAKPLTFPKLLRRLRGDPLIVEPVTHRMGVYQGGAE
jgi:hypothetical protein